MFKKKFKIYLFDNDYGTSYTTYINHARWHRWPRRTDKSRTIKKQTKKPTRLLWLSLKHCTFNVHSLIRFLLHLS